jgi:creatinine amidohydrolase
MTPRPYVLAECTWPEVMNARTEVAVLPWGATEAHNRHLPYATDVYESEAVAIAAAASAHERGARIMVLPCVPFGANTGQLDIPLTINMNPSTQFAVLGDVARSLAGQHIPKLVILNGHGGNDFRQMIRELSVTVPLFITQLNWYSIANPQAHFDEPGDHAGELETSVMQHIVPDLVRPLGSAGPGSARPFRIRALREGWAWAPRHWLSVTEDTGTGNPARATADKGKGYFEEVTAMIAAFFEELASADLDDLYDQPSGVSEPRR